MKLLRYGLQGQEKPALLDDQGVMRDLSQYVQDISPTILNPERLHALSEINPMELPAVEGQPRIGPCLSGVGKFLCIGLNYSDHACLLYTSPSPRDRG